MGNYFALNGTLPAGQFTAQADSQVTGGDPLEFGGDGRVHRTAAGSHYAGLAAGDAAAGATVTFYPGPALFSGTAEGAVTAGDELAASAQPGHQVKTAGAADQVIGYALTTAADGAAVKWRQR